MVGFGWEGKPIGPGSRCGECCRRSSDIPPHAEWCSRGNARVASPEPQAGEMKTPEQAAEEFYAEHPTRDGGYIDRADLEAALTRLLRQRDAEREARLREERGRAFDAGAEAQRTWECEFKTLEDADSTLAAARLAAVEGRKEGDADG